MNVIISKQIANLKIIEATLKQKKFRASLSFINSLCLKGPYDTEYNTFSWRQPERGRRGRVHGIPWHSRGGRENGLWERDGSWFLRRETPPTAPRRPLFKASPSYANNGHNGQSGARRCEVNKHAFRRFLSYMNLDVPSPAAQAAKSEIFYSITYCLHDRPTLYKSPRMLLFWGRLNLR